MLMVNSELLHTVPKLDTSQIGTNRLLLGTNRLLKYIKQCTRF